MTNATFNVVASSSSLIRYQWRFNDANIPNATNAVLSITNVQAGDWGEYTVVVTDDVGTILSAPAWLYPLVQPIFVVHPVSQSAAPGGMVVLSASATGWPPPFTFEWRQSSAILRSQVEDQPTSFFMFTMPNVVTSLQYQAVIKNPASPAGAASAFATVTTLADSDGDGIPDAWWSAYGLTNAPDRLADSDGDGMLNWQEYVAGTDPTNALSVLRFDWLTTSNGVALSFEAVSNRTYTVQYSETLGSSNWLKSVDLLARTNSRPEAVLGASDRSNRFYRVVTPRQP
jgi:hypothetical protein